MRVRRSGNAGSSDGFVHLRVVYDLNVEVIEAPGEAFRASRDEVNDWIWDVQTANWA